MIARSHRLLARRLQLCFPRLDADEASSVADEAVAQVHADFRSEPGMKNYTNWILYAGWRRGIEIARRQSYRKRQPRLLPVGNLGNAADRPDRFHWLRFWRCWATPARPDWEIPKIAPSDPAYAQEFWARLAWRASVFERRVFWLWATGSSYAQIVQEFRRRRVDCDLKSVDNALHRLRLKAERLRREMVPPHFNG